ncbi:hypothetical protein PISMIDRAFT_27623 [Pisolithus microcarpus 441]|uniref:MIT domain-containing protein n=1 Tax=Pisolithus microcarpus 441 TaxID=765257 RepID=A0A0D0A2H4_9AGAM|nr:hypothetical protein PISMIDRAFT_27623 [Pisolithus microcarpus 441]
MVLELNSRPPSIVHRSRQWHDHVSGLPSSPPPTAAAFPHAQRRRSSAATVPPAGPPPTQPIPSLPATSSALTNGGDGQFNMSDEFRLASRHRSSVSASQNTYGRSAASTNLAAVAAFPQAQQASVSPYPTLESQPSSSTAHPSTSSDPAPKSVPSHSKAHSKTQDIIPDRLLLSPTEPQSKSESRPSSRRALTRALELAREAVQLDATNHDPHAAVIAYGRSVALLSEVMERVRRGEDSTESRRRNGRRRSVVAQEEEVKRLKSIHDTYADRMNILSLIYSIPPIPHSPTSLYALSTSTESTQPPSPSSPSPSSDSYRSSSYHTDHTQDEPHPMMQDNSSDEQDAHEGIGSAMLNADQLSQDYSSPSTPVHPYASPNSSPTRRQTTLDRAPTVPPNQIQHTPSVGRPRASSVQQLLPRPVPSPLPPPEIALPPPPTLPPQASRLLEASRSRGNSLGHKRTGSGSKLTSVTEEGVRVSGPSQSDDAEHDDRLGSISSLPRRPDTPHAVKRDSHPLPPLPSPTQVHPFRTATVAAVAKQPGSPATTQFLTTRPRGESMTATSAQPIINPSIAMSTLHQRRNKLSAPPSTTTTASSSPTESSPSLFSLPPSRPSDSPTPSTASTSTSVTGRSRASSQPGRRPSVVNGRISPFEPHPPPLPQTHPNPPRKVSNASKLNQTLNVNVNLPPQLVVQTDVLSPPPVLSLAPPSAMLTHLPTTPISPLPPAPPADCQRKPYHLMKLLANTMISKSGGYITRRLHVPQGVWSQGGAKLSNIPEKVRVVEVLCSALEEMQQVSVELFGAGSVCSGLALGIGSVGRKEAEAWVAKLEDFSSICDSVVANFGRKLGVGEGFVLKKSGGVTSWGGKLTRQFDKFTNGKYLDSPAAYVTGLGRLFTDAQLLDEHSQALLAQPLSPIYAAFPAEARGAAEVKLKRASEFFATVVLTFVIRDLAQLLDKYAKKCEKWLAE